MTRRQFIQPVVLPRRGIIERKETLVEYAIYCAEQANLTRDQFLRGARLDASVAYADEALGTLADLSAIAHMRDGG